VRSRGRDVAAGGVTRFRETGSGVLISDTGRVKAQGDATGQFGKNHLGDLKKSLPTLHGFDEFFGYLYHLHA